MPHPLDNPVLSSLTGPHSRFAERRGDVLRYQVDVCPFVAMPDEPGDADWTDAARLAGPGGWLPLAVPRVQPPAGWKVMMFGEGVQMTGDHLDVAADPEAVPLGAADVPDMLELTARTKPGPFLPRTPELGTYLGIRRQGRLVAMAGERLHPAGWTEISAVCTDEAWRGHGLAARLILAVGAEIRARGEIPFLHVLATNTAIGLYKKLGFRDRRALLFAAARVPRAQPPDPARAALVTDQNSGALSFSVMVAPWLDARDCTWSSPSSPSLAPTSQSSAWYPAARGQARRAGDHPRRRLRPGHCTRGLGPQHGLPAPHPGRCLGRRPHRHRARVHPGRRQPRPRPVRRDGLDWTRYAVKLVLAGEVFSEEWRDLVGQRAGMSSPYYDSASLYGTADAGSSRSTTGRCCSPATTGCRWSGTTSPTRAA